MIKHKQILTNLLEFKLADFEEIDLLISVLDKKTIRKLIMNLNSKSGDEVFIAIEWSQ